MWGPDNDGYSEVRLTARERHGSPSGEYRTPHFGPARVTAFFIYGPQDRLPEQPSQANPNRWLFWGKAIALITLGVGLYYGPAYVTCRNMKERGMFYFGTTISTCMAEQMKDRHESIDAFARTVFTSL